MTQKYEIIPAVLLCFNTCNRGSRTDSLYSLCIAHHVISVYILYIIALCVEVCLHVKTKAFSKVITYCMLDLSRE